MVKGFFYRVFDWLKARNRNKQIADDLKSYWKNQNSGSADWRG